MTAYSTLSELLAKARQRSVNHLLLREMAVAAVVALACTAIILVAGTEFVSWLWLPVAAAVSLGIGFWRAKKQFPTQYEVAQKIDARLQLADSLSTAAHFSTDATALCEAQRAQAQSLVASVDLKQALPLARPRALYPAAALAAAVIGLFIARYAVTGSFDPHASLVKNAMKSAIDNFFSGPKEQALAGKAGDGNEPGDKDQQKAESKNTDFAGDSQFDPTAPEPQSQTAPEEKKDKAADKNDNDAKNGGKDAPDKSGDKSDKQNQDPNANQDAKGGQDGQHDPSMMDKLKQAVNDLMNKMKSPSDDAKNQKGEPQTDGEKQPGQDGQTQDKNQGEGTEAQKNSEQSADGQNSKNASQKKSNEQQQGMGSQEGDKTAKEADALKAMGKISELLGKRAENVKGSVTMEVGQTKQQLKTAVSERASNHSDGGGEIHRDTVPPAYEEFVQQYFEQVRKAPSPKPASSTTPPSGN